MSDLSPKIKNPRKTKEEKLRDRAWRDARLGLTSLEQDPAHPDHALYMAAVREALGQEPDPYDPTQGGRFCGALIKRAGSKRRGEHCTRKPKPGHDGRCRIHSAKSKIKANTPRGRASPHWKDGMDSLYDVPTFMAEQVRRYADHPDALSLSPQIAIMDYRINEMIKRLNADDGAKRWEALARAFRELEIGLETENELMRVTAMKEMALAINSGLHEFSIWRNIFDAFEQQRKLKDTDRKRIESMFVMIRSDAVNHVAAVIGEAFREYIPSDFPNRQTLLSKVRNAFQALTASGLQALGRGSSSRGVRSGGGAAQLGSPAGSDE